MFVLCLRYGGAQTRCHDPYIFIVTATVRQDHLDQLVTLL